MDRLSRSNLLGNRIRRRVDRENLKDVCEKPLTAPPSIDISRHTHRAQVAELVDALASGASSRKGVEVRVFSWAPLASVKDRAPSLSP